MDELCIVWFGSICMILREALSSFHWRSQDSFKSDQIYQISKRVLFLAAGHTNLTDIIFATKKSVKILWSLWHLSLAANYHRRTRTVGFADDAYRGHPSAAKRQKSFCLRQKKCKTWTDLWDFARSASPSYWCSQVSFKSAHISKFKISSPVFVGIGPPYFFI